jgi:hypothetical protein
VFHLIKRCIEAGLRSHSPRTTRTNNNSYTISFIRYTTRDVFASKHELSLQKRQTVRSFVSKSHDFLLTLRNAIAQLVIGEGSATRRQSATTSILLLPDGRLSSNAGIVRQMGNTQPAGRAMSPSFVACSTLTKEASFPPETSVDFQTEYMASYQRKKICSHKYITWAEFGVVTCRNRLRNTIIITPMLYTTVVGGHSVFMPPEVRAPQVEYHCPTPFKLCVTKKDHSCLCPRALSKTKCVTRAWITIFV